MKNLKKTIKIVIALVMMAAIMLSATGCGGYQGVCENCYQETTVHDYVVDFYGTQEDASFCDECAREVESLGFTLERR